MVSDQEIASGVESILLRHQQPNPNGVTLTINGVVEQLEAKHGINLSHKAGFIRNHIDLILRSHIRPFPHSQPPPPPTTTNLPKDHFTLQQHFHPQFPPPPYFALPRPQHLNFRHPTPPFLYPKQEPVPVPVPPPVLATAPDVLKECAPTGTKRRGGPGGLNKVCGVSPELQAIVGEPALPRTQIVKQLWAYIRKNNLQDPSNKRKIICDEPLRLVFETDCTDMFKMNKLLAKHIITLEPKKECGSDIKRLKVEVEPATDTSEAGSSTMVISDELAKFFGTEERKMVQSEAVRHVWDYIRENNLTDPLNSMMIICDTKLQELFGCESTSVVGISEMLMSHIFKNS